MSFSNELPDTLNTMGALSIKFLNRDVSILAFNERVLDLATRPEVPLLERLRFLCIVSSNLDEFFEVRAAPHLSAVNSHGEGESEAATVFRVLAASAHDLVARQYQLFNDTLMPEFAKHGIHLLSQSER
ncbi:MAG: polyphosphate kinase 1, partial [Polaromonas sp.]